MKKDSWKEKAWEELLEKIWDNRIKGVDSVVYTKEDLIPILSKYKKSGQGEIRIFHYEHEKLLAIKKRGISKLPLTRNSWKITARPPSINFSEPKNGGIFPPKNALTEGMFIGIKDTLKTKSNPGETTLLAIANHIGLISDFYNLKDPGVLFTGGRQRANTHILINGVMVDVKKAQIEIDGGFEWAKDVVIVEMKSSFKQSDFDINQVLIPLLKWQNLLKTKKVYSLVLLAETKGDCIEYWAYDFDQDTTISSLGMKIIKAKKYIIKI